MGMVATSSGWAYLFLSPALQGRDWTRLATAILTAYMVVAELVVTDRVMLFLGRVSKLRWAL